jgi:hypothetical protein
MSRCKYSYSIKTYHGVDVLVLIDKYSGNSMSLTNGIEDVYSEINSLDILPKKVIYRDTDGVWDGWDPKTNEFIILNASSETEALEKLFIKFNPLKISDILCDSCKSITLNPSIASVHYCSCCGKPVSLL